MSSGYTDVSCIIAGNTGDIVGQELRKDQSISELLSSIIADEHNLDGRKSISALARSTRAETFPLVRKQTFTYAAVAAKTSVLFAVVKQTRHNANRNVKPASRPRRESTLSTRFRIAIDPTGSIEATTVVTRAVPRIRVASLKVNTFGSFP